MKCMKKINVRVRGFRLSRMREFKRVLEAEEAGLAERLTLAVLALRGKQVQEIEARARYKVCLRCPIYNKELKACRQKFIDGDHEVYVGCGCYVPFKVTAMPEGSGCWGWKASAGRIGWK